MKDRVLVGKGQEAKVPIRTNLLSPVPNCHKWGSFALIHGLIGSDAIFKLHGGCGG